MHIKRQTKKLHVIPGTQRTSWMGMNARKPVDGDGKEPAEYGARVEETTDKRVRHRGVSEINADVS